MTPNTVASDLKALSLASFARPMLFLFVIMLNAIVGWSLARASGGIKSHTVRSFASAPQGFNMTFATMQLPEAPHNNSGKEAREDSVSSESGKSVKKADLAAVSVAYIEAVAQKQFDRVSTFLDPKIEFTTPGGKDIHGANDFVSGLKKIAPILVRNDVKKTFVDGNEVCIIYDFVTDTSVGVVPSMEWLTFRDGKIVSVRLIFHTQPWPTVLEELKKRTQPAA